MKVGGQWLRMLVDTGAAVSIVPKDVYSADIRHVQLQPTEVALQVMEVGAWMSPASCS